MSAPRRPACPVRPTCITRLTTGAGEPSAGSAVVVSDISPHHRRGRTGRRTVRRPKKVASAYLSPPSRAPPIPKWRNNAIPRMRGSRRAPERYAPATFFRRADASSDRSGPRRPPPPQDHHRHRPGPRQRGPPAGHRRGNHRHAEGLTPVRADPDPRISLEEHGIAQAGPGRPGPAPVRSQSHRPGVGGGIPGRGFVVVLAAYSARARAWVPPDGVCYAPSPSTAPLSLCCAPYPSATLPFLVQ